MQNVTMQLNYIANASVPSSSGRTLAVIDPSDGQPFDEIQRSNADDIDAAVHAALGRREPLQRHVGRSFSSTAQRSFQHPVSSQYPTSMARGEHAPAVSMCLHERGQPRLPAHDGMTNTH